MNALALFFQQAGRDGSGGLPAIAIIFVILICLVFFVIYIASLVWVYRDAERRGKSGILVALLIALISWPIGLLVWLLVRDKV
jgi:high-affinity K+ transport system ATPase subunit B